MLLYSREYHYIHPSFTDIIRYSVISRSLMFDKLTGLVNQQWMNNISTQSLHSMNFKNKEVPGLILVGLPKTYTHPNYNWIKTVCLMAMVVGSSRAISNYIFVISRMRTWTSSMWRLTVYKPPLTTWRTNHSLLWNPTLDRIFINCMFPCWLEVNRVLYYPSWAFLLFTYKVEHNFLNFRFEKSHEMYREARRRRG